MKYIFYPDVFWVSNFAMDFMVLYLVRYVRKSRSSMLRVIVACTMGATVSLILFLVLRQFELYQMFSHFVLNPCMILIAFPIKGKKRFWKDLFFVYGLMLLLGGILTWFLGNIGRWNDFWLYAVAAVGICALILHGIERGKTEQQAYEILLLTGNRSVNLQGFLDTGNLLTDPFVNQPVHILLEEVLQEELTKEQLAIRYIPYHSLGQEQGLLPTVTLKAMYIRRCTQDTKEAPIYLEKPVFGLAKEKLFQKKDYQVILNAGSISV